MSKAARRRKKTPGGAPPAGAGQPDSTLDRSASSRRRDPFSNPFHNPAVIDAAICLALILSTLFVYAQVTGFDFVNFDDPEYMQANTHVQAGLSVDGMKWAFSTGVLGNWMPVTMLSYMLDVQWFGLQSGMSHLVNVIIHALAAILLFAALRRATGATGLSAFVAFVFALHPLHVESVAWIAERKDVLSAFFAFLALYAYVRYTEKPTLGRYLAVAAAFCLGLMSKPMLVTFPFLLLLLDAWPLRRAISPKIVWEKIPLLALSAGASAVTFLVQGSSGFVQGFPLTARVENAFISYIVYLYQALWPARLAVYYPYPLSIPAWEAGAALAALVAISSLVIFVWRTCPYLAVGWFWYLGTLVPVIGIVQVGTQAHADRYMYLPLVGLTIALAWGAREVANRWAVKWPAAKSVLVGAGTVFCALCMFASHSDAEYWQNTETLYRRAIEATRGNDVAEFNLGTYLIDTRRYAEAIPHLATALRIKPDWAKARANLASAHYNLGFSLSQTPERVPDAIKEYETALQLDPNYPEAHNNLAIVLNNRGDHAGAIAHFEAAIRANPNYASASYNLASLLLTDGNYAAAIPHFEAAIRARPDLEEAHRSLAEALAKLPGRTPDAIREYEAALKRNPNDAAAHLQLGELLASLGRTGEAISHLEAGLRTNPDPAAVKILDRLLAQKNR
jgi:tetratricopeptide (TPR) repeat protein